MRFDWPALMRLGLNGLRLPPDRFWALTPAELMVMLGKDGSSAPLGRQRLEELARAFPDGPRTAPPPDGADHPTRSDGE
ncbi:MAG: phage tail assembly chaperone [Maritimibacter sp.]|nr:phage tail assembly chaperone [Maritimibacter sp.]